MTKLNNYNFFKEYPIPDKQAFREIQAGDDNEINSIKKYFLGRTWKEVDSEVLANDPQCIYFLTPRLVAYYLPSFFIAAETQPSSALEDVIVNYLSINLQDIQGFLDYQQLVEVDRWLTTRT
jgi:hypothetical protein